MNGEPLALMEFLALMNAQLDGKSLTNGEARRLSELLAGDPELVRLAVEMAVTNEACETMLSKLAL